MIRKNETEQMCSRRRKMRHECDMFGPIRLGDAGVEGRIILKLVFEKTWNKGVNFFGRLRAEANVTVY